jgi:hypothetical protein
MSLRSTSAILTFILLAIGAAGVGAWIVSQQQQAKLLQTKGRFSQLELALGQYYSDHNEFPPNEFYSSPESPPHSWRILLLPYLELGDFSKRYAFDELWNSKGNLALALELGQAPGYFRSPFTKSEMSFNADYFAVDPTEFDAYHRAGYRTHTVSEFPHQFLIVEIPDSQIHWLSTDSPTL